MRKIILAMATLLPLVLAGCSSRAGSAGLGALGGAAAGGGTYEYRLHHEMDRLESDYRGGRMDQREYDIRKDEIQRMELIK